MPALKARTGSIVALRSVQWEKSDYIYLGQLGEITKIDPITVAYRYDVKFGDNHRMPLGRSEFEVIDGPQVDA